MMPAFRIKFGLLGIASLLVTALAWSAAEGQIRPPMVRPPGFRPPAAPKIVNVWTCSKCGKEIGRGLSLPPDHCPHCGARIINGVGNGISQPGMRGQGGSANNPPNNPPMNPGFNPPRTNPPVVDPVQANNPPPVTNVNPLDNSSSDGTSFSSKKWFIALGAAVILVGLVALLGGTFLVVYALRSSGRKPSRPRRRRRDDDYDD